MSDYTVEELKKMLAEAEHKAVHQEFPKWVEVHADHIDRTNGHISVPAFPDYHIDRDDKVTVLVHNESEESVATSADKKVEAVESLKPIVDPLPPKESVTDKNPT